MDGTLTIGGTGVVEPNGPWVNYKNNIKSIIIGDEITGFGMLVFANYPNLASVYFGRGFKDMNGCFPFDGCFNLKSLVVDGANPYWSSENNILMDKAKTEIWDCAKGIQGALTIPSSVVVIGNSAFRDCNKITSVTIPSSVREIQLTAFQDCNSLESVIMEEGVEKIGRTAFVSCPIKSIILPNSLTSIASGAFGGTQLTSITIPKNVSSIGNDPFGDILSSINVVQENKYYSSEDGILFNKDKSQLIQYPRSKEGDTYTIPTSVNSIADNAFLYTRLPSIVISKNVSSIATTALTDCFLLNISVDAENTHFMSDDGVLFNKSKNTLIQYPPGKEEYDYIIPSSVNKIDDYAFWNNHLKSIVIPSSVSSIGNYAFFSDMDLRSVTILNSVVDLGTSAFSFCMNLDTLIVNWTTPPVLDDEVQVYYANNDPINDDPSIEYPVFYSSNTDNCRLFVPPGAINAYKAASVWKDFRTILEQPSVIPNETQSVGANGKGTIALNLSIPSNATLTGSFEISLPAGMSLDKDLTVLSSELSKNFNLVITDKGNNTWLVEIKSNALRNSMSYDYRNIMTIAYTVNDNVPQGSYKASIQNLDFLQDDGTPIKEDLITVPINVERVATSIENIGNTSFYACFINNMLRIESSQVETITIYSATGVRIYSVKKDAGSIDAPITILPGSVYIIKGSKSGIIKVVK